MAAAGGSYFAFKQTIEGCIVGDGRVYAGSREYEEGVKECCTILYSSA